MKTWTDEEVSILSKYYNLLPNEELYKLIPNKSGQAIYKKAYKLGFRKTDEIKRINLSNANRREKGSNWNGGKRHTAKGYVQVLMPEHHRADSTGYVMEHN